MVGVEITASEGVDVNGSRAKGPAPTNAAATEFAIAISRVYASMRIVVNAGKSHFS